jgi:hypothetical protein
VLPALARSQAYRSWASTAYATISGPSSVQRALDAIVKDELVARDASGEYRIAEPFLGEWLRRGGE